MISKLLCDMIEDIILRNQELVAIAVHQRAKFEGWLKFELAKTLRRYYGDTCVEYSAKVSSSQDFVDLYFDKTLLELKTPSTSYENPLCESKTRPITNNVDGIIADIDKLRQILPKISEPIRGMVAFVMFPLDVEEKLYMAHIDKITTHNSNVQPITKVIKLDNQIPILIYVAEVK